MGKNLVTTVRGTEAERSNCVKISNVFYEKNVDCFCINDKWYRKENPRIYFNHIENRYMFKTAETTVGIVKVVFDEKTKKESYEIGNFEKTFANSFPIYTREGMRYAGSREVFFSMDPVWSDDDACYVTKQYAVARGINISRKRKQTSFPYSFPKMYNCEALIPLFNTIDRSKIVPKDPRIMNNGISIFDKYSFGLEYETSCGTIPELICKDLGIIPLRDGSIGGNEYSTIPMTGLEGVNLIKEQLAHLKELCDFDLNCSLHVHFGNFDINESNILSLWNLGFALQDEIGTIFPYYIYETSNYKSGGKDYCKKLPASISSFDSLYRYISGGNLNFNGDFELPHPLNPGNERKWDNHYRYLWLNLINLMFGTKGKTAEFRIHNPTFNFGKVINWMMICMAILETAKTISPNAIPQYISLEHIVQRVYDDETARILIDYIRIRKDEFNHALITYDDKCGALDMINDSTSKYKTVFGYID